MNNLATITLKIFGWKIEDKVEIPNKCVICLAPHTSNWDFMVGLFYKMATKLKANFLIKKEWFYFPFGIFMKSIGGAPIDRSKKNSKTDQIAEIFNQRDVFRIAITPEGTRKANPDWKKGFYYIAKKANVPIVLGYINFKTKTVGIGKIMFLGENIDQDILEIKDFYRNVVGKRPENFQL